MRKNNNNFYIIYNLIEDFFMLKILQMIFEYIKEGNINLS